MTETSANDKAVYMGNCIERAFIALPFNQRMAYARSLAEIIIEACAGDKTKIEAAHQSLILFMNEAESKDKT